VIVRFRGDEWDLIDPAASGVPVFAFDRQGQVWIATRNGVVVCALPRG
jgi:ligand-binding sensor domain-containing protein